VVIGLIQYDSRIMKSATDVVATDLDLLSHQLEAEFDHLSGHSLLIAGGAGFLGYYLVQGALHWNRTHGAQPPIQVIVLDNFIRGVPGWLMALEQDSNLRLLKHDITRPLPAALGDVEYLIHAASIASPTYYRKFPIETMDANINGLRFLLDYSLAQKQKGKPVEGILF
jgi:UDP-glucuronate decarboxylase